jgi:hypothetical protein
MIRAVNLNTAGSSKTLGHHILPDCSVQSTLEEIHAKYEFHSTLRIHKTHIPE